jgi:hypothetical protein
MPDDVTTPADAPDSSQPPTAPSAPAPSGAPGGAPAKPDGKVVVAGKPGDPPADPDAEKPPDDPKFAQKLAALARKDRDLLAKATELKGREAKLAKYVGIDKAFQEDPLKAFQMLGLDVRDVVRRIALGNVKPTLEHEVKTLRKKQEEWEQTQAEQKKDEAQKTYDSQVVEVKQGIGNFLRSRPDDYELVLIEEENGGNAVEAIYEMIVLHHGKTGEIMRFEDAASRAEDHYLDRARKRAGAKKLQAAPAAPGQTGTKKPPANGRTQPTITSGHNASTAPAGAASAPSKPRTWDERIDDMAAQVKDRLIVNQAPAKK